MTVFYIRITSYRVPMINSFVGPFDSRREASDEKEAALTRPGSLAVYHFQKPKDKENGIRMHGTFSENKARQQGMGFGQSGRIVGRQIPLNYEELVRLEK